MLMDALDPRVADEIKYLGRYARLKETDSWYLQSSMSYADCSQRQLKLSSLRKQQKIARQQYSNTLLPMTGISFFLKSPSARSPGFASG